ncbi:MAG: hypothetical protein V4692_03175 [Bdellovibrionota bacterium]
MKSFLKPKVAVFLVAAVAIVASFQNCAPAEFQLFNDGSIDIQDISNLPPFACTQHITLTPDSLGNLDVPARATDGKCYAIKILSATANSASTLTTVVDSQIQSRNHGAGSATRNPYVLGAARLNIALVGARPIIVAGNKAGTAQILVDNFLFVAINSPSNGIAEKGAFGTTDSTIPGTNHILYNGQPVQITPFGSAGTSSITPLQLEGKVPINQRFELDVRALDCGSARENSDLWLVFQ